MKKFIKNNIFGFILGIIFTSIAGVLAYSYIADQISYTTDKNENVKSVGQALNDLYDKTSSGPTKENAPSGVTYKGIAYLDPTNLRKKCTENDAANNVNEFGTPTEIKTGCMKWYIFSETDENYNMILDHNTTARIKWSDSDSNSAYSSSNLKPIVDALMTESNWKLKPRLITTTEINTITGKGSFDINSAGSWYYLETTGKEIGTFSETVRGKHAWLYDNLGWCRTGSTDYGCSIEDNNTYLGYGTAGKGITSGYWTNDLGGKLNSRPFAWRITYESQLHGYYVDQIHGIRPVVTVPKWVFEN